MTASTRALTILRDHYLDRLAPYLATDYPTLALSNPHLHDHMLDQAAELLSRVEYLSAILDRDPG